MKHMQRLPVKHAQRLLLYLCFILVAGAGLAGENLKINIHGYISQGFLFSNHNNYLARSQKGSFQFNELGINFSTDVTDKLRVGIQLAARDIGDTGNDKVIIDWAFADYRWRDWLGIRVGKIKAPTGLYNKSRDLDMLRPFVLLPQGVYGEHFRDISTAMKGIGAYGNVSLKTLGDISYQLLFGTVDIPKESGLTKAVEGWNPFKVEKYDVDNLYCLALIWQTPLEGLRIGTHRGEVGLNMLGTLGSDIIISVPFPPYNLTIAQAGTPMTVELTDFLQVVYSLEYSWKDFLLAGEYRREYQTMVSAVAGLDAVEIKNDSEMYYVAVSYRFNKTFEAGMYYSLFYRNRDDRDGTKTPYEPTFVAFQKDVCLSLRFDLNDHWVAKLEGHLMDGTALCFYQDNLNENGVPEFDRKWFLLAAKMTFSF
ncbi:MAG: hypothetical protein GY765_05870 [bacterium]|nr:hypothetical protein [bacterium]